ncbi:MAG: tRNA 2-selenouridine(34) synthase MnmH [Pseudomonadota bacterium]
MTFPLPPLSDLADLPFDTLIDTRSPAEFAEDHIPGAINLPVLSDDERARVGTIYTQESPFKARKIGGALVARSIACHLEGPLAEMEGGWKPLVYCWRGGQRSGAFTLWLREVGWRAEKLVGGYQSYRRAVVRHLYDAPLPHCLLLLDGNTGTAKTELLARVAQRGAQVLDLEGLANHRGSVLGLRPGGQPSQKMFETRISAALAAFDPARPVLVEAESSKVGDLLVPPSLWKPMRAAPRLRLVAPASERVAYLCKTYADLFADLPLFKERLALLAPIQGHARITAWHALADAGDFAPLVADLIERHYDKRYSNKRQAPPHEELPLSLDAAGLERAADEIAQRLAQIGAP